MICGVQLVYDVDVWCAFECSWVGGQLAAITGSDDLTLAKFCMTLDSQFEITEYFVQYLVSGFEVPVVLSPFPVCFSCCFLLL